MATNAMMNEIGGGKADITSLAHAVQDNASHVVHLMAAIDGATNELLNLPGLSDATREEVAKIVNQICSYMHLAREAGNRAEEAGLAIEGAETDRRVIAA